MTSTPTDNTYTSGDAVPKHIFGFPTETPHVIGLHANIDALLFANGFTLVDLDEAEAAAKAAGGGDYRDLLEAEVVALEAEVAALRLKVDLRDREATAADAMHMRTAAQRGEARKRVDGLEGVLKGASAGLQRVCQKRDEAYVERADLKAQVETLKASVEKERKRSRQFAVLGDDLMRIAREDVVVEDMPRGGRRYQTPTGKIHFTYDRDKSGHNETLCIVDDKGITRVKFPIPPMSEDVESPVRWIANSLQKFFGAERLFEPLD